MISKLFAFFQRKGRTCPDGDADSQDYKKDADLTSADVFSDPLLLASWVKEYFLDRMPISSDYELLPDDESRAALQITPEQRDRCLCEYSILRIAGTSLVVKNHYDDKFWLRYTDQITRHLLTHISEVASDATYTSVRVAVEDYVRAAHKNDGAEVATLYMRRIYDDNPNYIRMKVSGIGRIGHDTLIEHNDVFLDAYCRVKYGTSYDEINSDQGAAVE